LTIIGVSRVNKKLKNLSISQELGFVLPKVIAGRRAAP
jgi:hypothetical protein